MVRSDDEENTINDQGTYPCSLTLRIQTCHCQPLLILRPVSFSHGKFHRADSDSDDGHVSKDGTIVLVAITLGLKHLSHK